MAAPAPTTTRRASEHAPLAAVLALAAITFWPTFVWMAIRGSEEGGYYLHGFAVPPAAAWLAWRSRDRARWGSGGGTLPGLALLAAGALLQVPAALLEIHFLSGAALLLVAAGIVLALGGRAAFAAWWPVLLFAGFMVPLPLAAVAQANVELKIAAAGLALEIAQALGVVVVRDGAVLVLEGGRSLVVGTVCSGLRFLVSLTALGAFVALASPLSAARRAVLFACALPVAFAANVLRVLVLVLVADRWGTEAVTGTVHDVSGWLLFAVALAALLAAEARLGRGRAGAPGGAS